jgi:hypothetical protein
VKTQNHDFSIRQTFANLPGGLKPIQLRHPDVHHHDGGLGLQRHGYSFAAGLASPHFPARALEQEFP